MPPFELTFIFRPMAKNDLVNVVKRQLNNLLDRGAVITDIQSLGHRDLPFRRVLKQTKEIIYTTNSMLVHASLSTKGIQACKADFLNDRDLLWIGTMDTNKLPEQPTKCDLWKFLQPPAYRESVEELRRGQKMAPFTRFKVYKGTEREFKNQPKAYYTTPPRR